MSLFVLLSPLLHATPPCQLDSISVLDAAGVVYEVMRFEFTHTPEGLIETEVQKTYAKENGAEQLKRVHALFYAYNTDGRLRMKVEHSGSGDRVKSYVRVDSYVYDKRGNLTEAEAISSGQAEDREISMYRIAHRSTYDSQGRRASLTRSDGEWRSTWSADGLTETQHPASGDSKRIVTTYSPQGDVLSEINTSQVILSIIEEEPTLNLFEIDEYWSGVIFTYDSNRRVIREDFVIGSYREITTTAYDERGQVKQEISYTTSRKNEARELSAIEPDVRYAHTYRCPQ